MTKFGIISLGSKSSQMVAKEAEKYFDEVSMIDIRKIEIQVSNNKTQVLYDSEPLENFDCLYLKGSYRYSSLLYGITEIFKKNTYIPIESHAHLVAHNKFMTHLNFSQNKELKMPSTYYTAKISEAKKFLNTLNYPIILKFPTGTHGKGVIFSDSYKSAVSMIDALNIFKQPILVQDFIDIQSDIRVIVAGEKIIGSMRRIAKKGEIRANSHQGGGGEPFVVTTEIKKMSIEAAKKIKAEICAVDLIESDYGPLILEVNTSPGLQKITEVTKKNIADEIAKYLYEKTLKFVEKRDKRKSKNILSNVGIDELENVQSIQTELRIRNEKIILPEFAYKMSHFSNGQEVSIKVSKNQIIITRED